MKLYNTLTKRLEEFKPIKVGEVGIYSCGPTVYWNQHIGNMYAFLCWDLLVRSLRFLDYKVKWVMNITDVGHLVSDEDEGEDKMEKGAKREGLTVWEVAKKYEQQFLNSMDMLNIRRPDVICRATEHITEQIELIKKIKENGFAYQTKTGLVFDTAKFADYAKFANLDLANQDAGQRTEVDVNKKNPWDFLLWITNQPEHIMKWDSPWGVGFPGWHIECTAMSVKYLGETFDIHTGGKEHVMVHHTNEIAQAFGAFGHQTANYWLHNEWLTLKEGKMSKSLGNVYTVQQLQEMGFEPLAFRYLVMMSGYRQGLVFSLEGLEAAQTAWKRLRQQVALLGERAIEGGEEWLSSFVLALEDDLNIAKALAVFNEMMGSSLTDGVKRYLVERMDRVLGLELLETVQVPEEVLRLRDERLEEKKKGNFVRADEIRATVERMGFGLVDTTAGTSVVKK